MLILLILKQAVYHTIRARKLSHSQSQIMLSLQEDDTTVILSCAISNPEVATDTVKRAPKDASDLRKLARKLSMIRDHRYTYTVDGPSRDHSASAWKTAVVIRQKREG